MLIREMNKDDIDEVISCEKNIFGKTLGASFYNDRGIKNISKHYVATIDKKIIGYIGLWITPPTGQIINFFVNKEVQNRKIGTKLLSVAMEFFKEKKAYIITLEVRKANIVAQKIYKNFGFINSHFRNNYYDDGEDAILMLWEEKK